ncbi:hypothetical protein [Shouchella shacheensis]|uniref:flagellar biosynthesis protein FlhF n=1 Tax=Shouchella shacheensis TaxID=1649580 RepID=UPI00073FF8A5|nr:hypothetical protein [Shouchella shacheensis]
MRIEKFQAQTMDEAVVKIRAALGPDAVILHTKEQMVGGWFGFFGRKQLEITAGANEERDATLRGNVPKKTHQSSNVRQFKEYLENHGVRKQTRNKLCLLAGMIEQQGVINARELGVKTLQVVFGQQKAMSFAEKRVITIAGPTGVGKTTTIAKLAADAVFHQRKRVAFITADTYRIAAVEQLKTYAGILKCPVRVAYNAKELIDHYHALSDFDCLFIDTEGRNYLREQAISSTTAIQAFDERAVVFLALSLTAKPEDLIQTIDSFGREAVDGVVFTKMDETVSRGSMIEAMNALEVPCVSVTMGQNVPQDLIVRPDRDRLIEWAMEGMKDGSS